MKPLLTLQELLNKLTHLKIDSTTESIIKNMGSLEVLNLSSTISIKHFGDNLYTLTKIN
jgi:hypothetical protein